MEDKERIAFLARELENAKEPNSILIELLSFLDKENEQLTALVHPVLFAYFEALKQSSPHEIMGETIKSLRSNFKENTPAAEFLDISYKAYELILDNAYKSLIRTLSGSYTSDGSVLCCPVCNSRNVYEGENSMYEFTHMICRDCGNWDLADEYQLVEWYRKVE